MIKKGVDISMLAAGGGGVVLGLVGVWLGLFTNMGIRISIIPIYGWVLAAIGGVIVLLGIVGAFASLRQKKCASCNAPLEPGMCAFPPTAEREVMDAINSSDAAALDAVPMGSLAEPHVKVSLDFCDKCRNVASLSVGLFGPSRRLLMTDQLLQGPFVDALAAVVQNRESAHEERYEKFLTTAVFFGHAPELEGPTRS